MRLASFRRHRNVRFEIIPMIDIFMILSLFLTVMAFLPQITDAIKAQLPTSKTAQKTPPSVMVQLQTDGALRFQGAILDPEVLDTKIKLLLHDRPDTAIIIAADKALPYQKVITLIDALKTDGVKRLALATAH